MQILTVQYRISNLIAITEAKIMQDEYLKHCMALVQECQCLLAVKGEGKWKQVHYSDYIPLCTDTISDLFLWNGCQFDIPR
jgi:hypothetical protein